MCLLATKGKPKRLSKSVPQLVVDKRREHSRKPDIIYNHIENLLEGPYIEMFARQTRKGWDQYGNEVTNGIDFSNNICYNNIWFYILVIKEME